MDKPYEKKTYYEITLDPVHIGTGGYRLGRVDNTITREPGTNLPKIPGTSLAGVIRAYTAMAVQNGKFVEMENDFTVDYKIWLQCKYQRPAYKFSSKRENGKAIVVVDTKNNNTPLYEGDDPFKEKYYSCAGKGAGDGEGHCGEPDCPVCVTFGFSKGSSNSSFQGLAQFFDARLLFFPAHSMIGPVWVTSPSVLSEFANAINGQSGVTLTLDLRLKDNDDLIQTDLIEKDKPLNLGWILLKNKEKENPLADPAIPGVDNSITSRLVLVPDRLFPRIVNDNLEVRTSVAIDPATGAAEEGALYTYEAIPRATVIWFEVLYNKPEYFIIKQNGHSRQIQHDRTNGEGWRWLEDNVKKGLRLLEHMGVGGMNTRGMGRLRILNLKGI